MAESSTIHALAERLRGEVARGRPGDRLPTMRELTQRHHVSPVTVARVISQLVAEGSVTTRPGAGTFVAERPGAVPLAAYDQSWQTIALGGDSVDDRGMRLLAEVPPPGVVPLASGYPHASLTASRQLTAALTRVMRRPGMWERPPVAGVMGLRRWFAEQAGPQISADDVLITSGAQAALSVTLRALVPAGGPVLVESPTYPGALAVSRAAGLRPIPIPVDADGIRTDLLAEAFAITGARVVYCQPTFQNPTGTTISAERREHLLAVAKEAGAFVIEDDFARWLSHDNAPPPPLIAGDVDGRVVHIRSLTKSVAPSLRIGALVTRGPVAQRLRALRVIDDFFVARVLQEAAAELVASAAWPRHLATLSAALRVRRREMVAALTAHAPGLQLGASSRGGLYVWARLSDGTGDVALAEAAQRAGVMVSAGRPYFAAEPPGDFVRVSFAATAHPGEMEEGVRRLASVLG